MLQFRRRFICPGNYMQINLEYIVLSNSKVLDIDTMEPPTGNSGGELAYDIEDENISVIRVLLNIPIPKVNDSGL